jgi:transposase, IS30 family
MTDYTHLSMRDRCLIATFLSMDAKVKIIADRSGRHRSTIYREINRNKLGNRYMPGVAHAMAEARHPRPSNKLETNIELNKYVLEGLNKGWSPEQISGRMKVDKKDFFVCHESIYRYIYQNKNLGLYKLLPKRKAKRHYRSTRKIRKNRNQLARYNISLRSDEINLRQTLGHWEGDTIRFQQDQKTCVTTLVERKSRYVCLRKNKDKKTQTVIDHIFNKIKSTPKKIWGSLTLDRGSEFMSFRKVERKTTCKVYFCDPHSPWQRGSNENMNGRLRRFLPKNLKIDRIKQQTLDRIAIQANNTPRKCLNYQTPEEVMMQHWKSFCRTTL